MHIVLPGALPDAGAARALLPHLAKTAPTLSRWLSLGQAHIHDTPGTQTGCTPEEYWQLQLRGFHPKAGQNQAAGLGPLLAEPNSAQNPQPVWLAELVHVSPTQHGASMLSADELAIDASQSAALLDSLSVLCAAGAAAPTPSQTPQTLDCGDFTLRQLRPGLLQVQAPADFALLTASPAQVARSAVNDWWPHQASAGPWRRLFNEIQMLWFDHPVNHQRQQLGLPPINGLWLFGGATPAQLDAGSPEQVHWHADLLPYALQQDWGGWLQALGDLDNKVLRAAEQQGLHPSLALTGRERVVEIKPTRQPAWLRKLSGRNNAWRNWWSPQN
ncbi:hypothetical protein H0484_04330 [Pusillimonas sp. CC-YST705]|uniref:Cofactor-independent phosphoglycerate mutase n=1 Tax=Mesopusillimonas faecipullorum TaxID=2755040 RepID=A0ABS8CAC2_9BURK|nr:hypothetical protein [Mesopusillimonas faecipullorum]MCB5362980.1 hypothetical protein [Mesopusillimonas faecipullorum]